MLFEARYQKRDAVLLEHHELYRAHNKHSLEMAALNPQKRNYFVRITVLTLLALGIFAFAMTCKNIPFKELPSRIKHLMKTPIGWKTGVILGSIGLLIGGAAFIIYRVTRGKGKFRGDDHYQPVVLNQAQLPGKEKLHWKGSMHPSMQLIDKSRLKDGSGKTYAYQRKVDGDHEMISASVIAVTPIITTCSIAYNVIRLVVIPFYILGRMVQEVWTGKSAYEGQRKFHIRDIPKQMALSLYWALRTPFYATAYLFATLYSFIDPMGGRKLGSLICNEWMEGIDRHESVWTCYAMNGHKFEGGGGPDKLGHQAYFWTGCWMPWAEVEYKNGAITRAYYPGELFDYDVYNQIEHGCSVPDLHEIPEMTSAQDPFVRVPHLPIGHFQYVSYNNQLHICAHVTRRVDGQRLFVARRIDKKPKDVDALLNETVRTNTGLIKNGEQVAPLLRALQDSKDAAPNGFYRLQREGDKLYHQTANAKRKVLLVCSAQEQLKTLHKDKLPQKAALHLELGRWRKVQVGKDLYILAHIQDEWGNHLYIESKVLDGEDTDDINPYLQKILRLNKCRTVNGFGEETADSQLRRSSINIIKREVQPSILEGLEPPAPVSSQS